MKETEKIEWDEQQTINIVYKNIDKTINRIATWWIDRLLDSTKFMIRPQFVGDVEFSVFNAAKITYLESIVVLTQKSDRVSKEKVIKLDKYITEEVLMRIMRESLDSFYLKNESKLIQCKRSGFLVDCDDVGEIYTYTS